MSQTAAPPPKSDLDAMTLPEKDLPEVAFPGAVEREYRVVFDDSVHAEVTRHSAETVDVELAGILVGELRRDRSGPYLAITGAIRGEFAENEGAQVKLTHATWDHVHKVKDEKFPKAQIVGWYHTHPGFGIFLSSMDVFIHEFFFNHAPQIALVVDPRTGEQGVFIWRAGKIDRAPRFWVGSTPRACATGPVSSRPVAARAASAQGPGHAHSSQGAATYHEAHADEDELDILKIVKSWFFENWMLLVGFLFGFLICRVLFQPLEAASLRNDLYRNEVRSLVGSTASAFATSEDLQRLDVRLADVASLSSGSNPANLARIDAGIRDLQREVQLLRGTANQREAEIAKALTTRAAAGVSIEDEVRAFARESQGVSRESQGTRALALECYVMIIRMRIDSLGGKLSAGEQENYRMALEHVALEGNDPKLRDALRARFPELYPPPAPPPATGPQLPAGGK